MNIAVLFDGAGLARLGLERAGHTCVGYELDPLKHHLGRFVGSGNTHLRDVRDVNLTGFDAVWASPPCQLRSSARTQGAPVSEFAVDLLEWSLKTLLYSERFETVWIENVTVQGTRKNDWGQVFNAAQFSTPLIQNRNRVIGGRYRMPEVHRPYQKWFPGVCPCVTATEYKGCASDKRRASRFYGRRLTIEECAYHQGFEIPAGWAYSGIPYTIAEGAWKRNLYEAIGNGVPVYMAEAFGRAYKA